MSQKTHRFVTIQIVFGLFLPAHLFPVIWFCNEAPLLAHVHTDTHTHTQAHFFRKFLSVCSSWFNKLLHREYDISKVRRFQPRLVAASTADVVLSIALINTISYTFADFLHRIPSLSHFLLDSLFTYLSKMNIFSCCLFYFHSSPGRTLFIWWKSMHNFDYDQKWASAKVKKKLIINVNCFVC